MLKTLTFIFYWLQKKAISAPVKTLVFFGLIYLIGAGLTPNLRVLISVDDLIDPGFETYDSLQKLNEDFINKNNTTLIINKSTQMTKGDFCKINSHLNKVKLRFEGLTHILSSADVQYLEVKGSSFNFKKYINHDCYVEIDYDKPLVNSKRNIQKNSPWSGIISSEKNNDFLIEFYFAEAESTQFGQLDVENVSKLKESWTSFQKDNPEFSLQWFGDGIFQHFFRKGYDKIMLLNLIAMLFILIAFRLFWGTYKSGLLYIISIAVTSTIVLGGMALTNTPMDVLSNSISLMLFISSIEDFIFLSYLRSKNQNWKLPFKKILIPSFLTSFTTFIGFGSLYFTDLEIIQRFGIWAAFGAIIEWLIMFYFLPALISKFSSLQNWVKQDQDTQQAKWLMWINKISLPKAAGIALLLIMPVGIFGAQKIEVYDSPQAIFPESHPGRKDLKYLLETRGWQSQLSLIFSDKKNIDFNKAVLEKYKRQNFTVAIEDPYKIDKHLSEELEPRGIHNIILRKWRKSFFGKKYHTSNSDELRSIVYVNEIDIKSIQKIIDYNKLVCPSNECYLAGSLVSYAEFGSRILVSLYKSFAISLLLVTLLLLLLTYYFKVKHKLILVLSSLWGPLALVSIFYLFDFSITYVTSLIASILVGLAGDNAIQFIYRKESLHKSATYYQNCSLLIIFCMIGISMTFFLSDFAQIQKLGLFMIMGFILNYIGDVFILKSITK